MCVTLHRVHLIIPPWCSLCSPLSRHFSGDGCIPAGSNHSADDGVRSLARKTSRDGGLSLGALVIVDWNGIQPGRGVRRRDRPGRGALPVHLGGVWTPHRRRGSCTVHTKQLLCQPRHRSSRAWCGGAACRSESPPARSRSGQVISRLSTADGRPSVLALIAGCQPAHRAASVWSGGHATPAVRRPTLSPRLRQPRSAFASNCGSTDPGLGVQLTSGPHRCRLLFSGHAGQVNRYSVGRHHRVVLRRTTT